LNRTQFLSTTGMGLLLIVLVIADMVMFNSNRALQADLNRRAQFVQQSQQLEGLFNDMVRALADMSARTNDEQLKALLQSVGITFTVNPSAQAASAPRK